MQRKGKWSAWSEPLEVLVKYKPKLAIHVPTTITAGEDLTFSFDEVENAASYKVSFYSASGDIWKGVAALPNTYLTVPGYFIDSGHYTLSVSAYADGYSTSSNTIHITASGSRPDGPNVSVDEPLRIKSTAVFSINTENAEALEVKYQFRPNNIFWLDKNIDIPVTGNTTVWEQEIVDFFEGVV